MSNKKLDKVAGNMTESLGAAPAAVDPASKPAAVKPLKFQGWKNAKGGVMELDVSPETGVVTRDPTQPRTVFDDAETQGLADSIKARGQIQPGSVRWDEAVGKWVVVTGERRFRACQLAGVPFRATDYGDKEQVDRYFDQVLENVQRSDLNPREQAVAYRQLLDSGRYKSARELAKELGIDPTKITRALAILDLPGSVQDKVSDGTLAATAAHEIAKLPDAASQQEVANRVVNEKLSRDQVREAVVSKAAELPAPAPAPAAAEATDVADGATTEEPSKPKKPGRKRGVTEAKKTSVKKLTEWKDKAENGYAVTVAYKKGIDLSALVLTLKSVASKLEGTLQQSA